MPHINSKFAYGSEEFQAVVDDRRRKRMDAIDNQPPAIRALVHDYGWSVVNAFLLVGVKEPRHIRHLVETTLNEFSPTRGSNSMQGKMREKGIAESHPLARHGEPSR